MDIKNRKKARRIPLACFLLVCAVLTAATVFAADGGIAAYAEECGAAAGESEPRAKITVTVGQRKYVYNDNILPAPDHTVYEQLERRNINAPLSEKMKTVDKCLNAGAKWKEAVRYSFPRLTELVDRIKSDNERDPEDSNIVFKPDRRPMFVISRSAEGASLDEKRLYQDIYLALKRGAVADVTARFTPVVPAVTVQDNIKLTKKISSFSTSFASSADGRKNNIRLALRAINGTVLAGGEEFSFNGVVGARTEKKGYCVAKIIVGGEYVEGVGGGVCQVSTTLYNAALCAGMNVTCVKNHTIQPSYVPPSLDAMVNSSSSDLRFINPYTTPVFIKAESDSDTARITFYGAEPEYVIKTVSRVVSRTEVPEDKEIIDSEHKFVDEVSPAGTRVRVSYGHAGVKSEAFLRYFTKSGALVREEKIRSDNYAKTQGIVAVAP